MFLCSARDVTATAVLSNQLRENRQIETVSVLAKQTQMLPPFEVETVSDSPADCWVGGGGVLRPASLCNQKQSVWHRHVNPKLISKHRDEGTGLS